MFDGKIARTKKDRTDDEKSFGIQIDSLCDVVCFGAFPALICYLLGVRGFLGLLIIAIYCVCSVIRLAFFNVLEGKRQQTEEGANHYYHGLPITSMSVVLPLIFLTQFFIPDLYFIVLLHIVLLVVGILFVVDFPFRKPKNSTLAVLVAVVGAALIVLFVYNHFRAPRTNRDTSPIIEKIIEEIE